MAKTLLISKLPEDVNEILEDYKRYNPTNENTKASIAMMRMYPKNQATIQKQRAQIRNLEKQYSTLLQNIKNWHFYERAVRNELAANETSPEIPQKWYEKEK